MIRARVGHRSVLISDHAVERYGERVKPTLSKTQVVAEIPGMVALGELQRRIPTWAARTSERADEWIVIGDSIAFPVLGDILVTCITRSEVGAEIRTVRQEERKRTDPDGFRRKHKQHGKVARDERRRARDLREGTNDA